MSFVRLANWSKNIWKKYVKLGETTLEVEVTNISPSGIWLILDNQEKFLSFQDFPWFEYGTVRQIKNVERLGPRHLYWPELDVDIHTDSIDHPESYPLKAKVEVPTGLAR